MKHLVLMIIVFVFLACGEKEAQDRALVGAESSGTDPSSSQDDGDDPSADTGDDEGGGSNGDKLLTFSGTQSFKIFKYEARVVTGKATSVEGVVPTVSINFADAKSACEAAGYRLCTYQEWVLACEGPQNLKFGFAETHDEGSQALAERCDVARTENNSPGSMPSATGSHPDCVTTDFEIYDMIGNATEWTINSSDTPVAAGVAFYQPEEQSYCEATLSGGGAETMDPTTESTDLGFRCCLD